MNKKIEKMGDKWEVFEDLRRCLNIYAIFKYIYERHECVASEIISRIEICKSTLYDYIDKGVEADLLYKNFNKELYKNGAHFMIVARPQLKKFLRQFKIIILNFLDEMSEYQNNL